jgi:hypothetical protein
MTQQSIHDRIMSRNQTDRPVLGEGEPIVKAKRNRLTTAIVALVGLAVVGGAGYAAVHFEALRNLVSPSAAANTKNPDIPLANTPFLQHAKQAGVQVCSTVFPVLGELLTNGSRYSVQSSWNTSSPDKHALQAVVGMEYATERYSGAAAGIVFAAPTGSACEGTMVRVAPFSTSCADMPSLLPPGSRATNNLGKVAVYELGNNGGNALLLPSGNTCVVISVMSAAR